MRIEEIDLDRTSRQHRRDRAARLPVLQDWRPATGRLGYTWEALPGLTFYSQYATAADVAASNIFLLGPTQPLNLTRARTYRDRRQEICSGTARRVVALAVRDRAQERVFGAGRPELNIAGKQISKGVEVAAAVRPSPAGMSGATSPTSTRTTKITSSIGGTPDRSRATRRRTCRASSSTPARPTGLPTWLAGRGRRDRSLCQRSFQLGCQ